MRSTPRVSLFVMFDPPNEIARHRVMRYTLLKSKVPSQIFEKISRAFKQLRRSENDGM